MEPNIFLIGPRACGKTTLGRKLAMRLNRSFMDTDSVFNDHTGKAVASYVEEHGWEGFRDMESEVLAAVCRDSGRIVACGGGIVLRPENREHLKSGLVLYLQTAPHTLAARLTADPDHGQRPSLTGSPIEDEIAEVLAERAPLYEECADVILPGGESMDILVDMAVREIKSRRSEGSGLGIGLGSGPENDR